MSQLIKHSLDWDLRGDLGLSRQGSSYSVIRWTSLCLSKVSFLSHSLREVCMKSPPSFWSRVSSPWAVPSPAPSSSSTQGPPTAGSASCWLPASAGFCPGRLGACGLMWVSCTPGTTLGVTAASASSSYHLGRLCYLRYAVVSSWLSL